MEGRGAARPEEHDLVGLAADALTLARLVVAVALIPVLGARRVTLGAVLLGSAWISDFLDGRAARASAGRTRLGDVDLWADTFVGAGAVLGFTLSGWIPPALGLGLVGLLLAAFALSRNEAMSMLLQATAYALAIWRTWRDGHPAALWWLLIIITVIAVVNRRIFWQRSLPIFLGGVAALFRRRPSSSEAQEGQARFCGRRLQRSPTNSSGRHARTSSGDPRPQSGR